MPPRKLAPKPDALTARGLAAQGGIWFVELGEGFSLEHQAPIPGGAVVAITDAGPGHDRVLNWSAPTKTEALAKMATQLEQWAAAARALIDPPASTSTASTIAGLKAQLDVHSAALGARRDALRALKDNIDEELTDADGAIEHLEAAIDVLSGGH